jgi:phage baseplate assembly protein V
MMNLIHQATADMRDRMRLMVGRAILAAVNDAGAIQTAQADCLADETHDDVERIQQYGFTSVPLAGAEAVLVFPAGNRDHGLIIAVDDRRYRLKALSAGEVALYTDEGDNVTLKRGHIVEINTHTMRINATTKVELNTPLVTTTGEIKADLDVTDHQATTPKTMAGMRTVYNSHTHSDPQGGSVSTPTGTM